MINKICLKIGIKSPAVTRKNRPYCLHLNPSVQLQITKKKRFLRGDSVTVIVLLLLSSLP